jgi:hypothetical protein
VAGELPPPDVSPRGLTIAMVNRVLGGRRPPTAECSFGLLAGARRVAWTPETHAFVCSLETRRAVRVVLLMLCRCLGSTTGSQMAIRVLQLVFAPSQKVDEELGASTPRARVGDNLFDAEEAALELPASVGPSPCVVLAPQQPRRVRFAFMLQPVTPVNGDVLLPSDAL